jgi:hypothetical protein
VFREQIFGREAAMTDALLVGVLQEGFERRAVGIDTIGPMIFAE